MIDTNNTATLRCRQAAAAAAAAAGLRLLRRRQTITGAVRKNKYI